MAAGTGTTISASAGNLAGDSPCSNSISYAQQDPDTKPPQTNITDGPGRSTRKKRARFTFSSSEDGSSFDCKLDKGRFSICSSPARFAVERGRHTLTVRATDTAGNVDPSPASYDWKRKRR